MPPTTPYRRPPESRRPNTSNTLGRNAVPSASAESSIVSSYRSVSRAVLATSSPYWHEEEGPSKWVLPLPLRLLTLEGAAADDPSAPRHAPATHRRVQPCPKGPPDAAARDRPGPAPAPDRGRRPDDPRRRGACRCRRRL